MMNALAKINKLGFNENKLDNEVKTLIFKTYIRPILHYGLDNIVLNHSERRKLQVIESIIIKRALGLTKKAYTLLLALNIEKFYG